MEFIWLAALFQVHFLSVEMKMHSLWPRWSISSLATSARRKQEALRLSSRDDIMNLLRNLSVDRSPLIVEPRRYGCRFQAKPTFLWDDVQILQWKFVFVGPSTLWTPSFLPKFVLPLLSRYSTRVFVFSFEKFENWTANFLLEKETKNRFLPLFIV